MGPANSRSDIKKKWLWYSVTAYRLVNQYHKGRPITVSSEGCVDFMAYFDFLGLGVASLISLLLKSPSHINIIDSQITLSTGSSLQQRASSQYA